MFKYPLALLIVCISFLSSASAFSEDTNIFFLDRAKGEDTKLIDELSALTPTAGTNINLGWLHLLYKNDAVKAKEYFQKALDADGNNLEALDGLGKCHWWLGDDEADMANDIKCLKIDPNAPWLELALDNIAGADGGQVCPNCGRIHGSGSGNVVGLSAKKQLELLQDLLVKPLANKFNETYLKERLLGTKIQLSGVNDALFNEWKGLGYPDKWLVIGYFKGINQPALDEAFPPERRINPDAKYTVDDWDIKWHKRQATISNFNSFVSTLDDPIENRGECIYLLTYINSPTEREAVFTVNSGQSYKIWLNDNLIAVSDPGRSYLPYYQSHSGRLQPGYNKLLLKFLGSAQEVQITDLAGAPFDDLSYENNPVAYTTTANTGVSAVKPNRGNREYYLSALKDPARRTLNDYIAQDAFYYKDGLAQEAFGLVEEIYKSHTASALANVLMGRAYEANQYLPTEKRKNLARACYKEAEKLADTNIPAKLELADYYSEKNKDKAAEYLQKVITMNPKCLTARQKLERLFESRNWPAEAFDQLNQLAKLQPDNTGLLFRLANYYSGQNNYEKASEYYKRAYDLDGTKYRWAEINLQSQLGNYQPTLAAYAELSQAQPDSTWPYHSLARTYRELKDFQKTEELYLKLLSLAESDRSRYDLYDDFAALYDEWDKPDKAREYRQKLNELPGKYQRHRDDVRRYYDFKDNKQETWPDEITVPVDELVKNAPGEKEYPQAGSIILFEQHVVRITGDSADCLRTKETRVHEVIKLLNKQSGEQYGNLYKYGELEEARVYKDSRVLEPDPIQESWDGLRLPELDKGSVIELKYIKREPFYYREPGEITQIDDSPMFRREKQPVLHLRYVIALPKSVKYKCPPKYQSFTPLIKDDGQTITYVWDLKNIPDYDDEVMMPSEKEVLPWVDIYAGTFSFDKKLQAYRSEYLTGRVPYNVKAKAEDLTKDIADISGKIRTLYKFAVSEIKGGYGSSNDISLSHTLIEAEGSASGLMMGFLKALNIEAYWALPKPKFAPGAEPDKQGPLINEYNTLIYIPPDTWLSPGQFMPFGAIPSEIQGGNAYVIMPEGIKVLELPTAPFEERCANSLDLEIKVLADGTAEVKGSLNLGGENGAQWRTYLREYSTKQQKKQLVESIVGSLFPGAKLNKYGIPKFDMDQRVTGIDFTCSVPQFARRSDDPAQLGKTAAGLKFKTILKPLELSRHLLRETERKFALRLQRIGQQLNTFDRIKIILPDEAGSLEADAEIPKSILLATDFGYYSRWVKSKGRTINIERKFALEDQDIPPQYYQAFSDFCKKIEQVEQDEIKLILK